MNSSRQLRADSMGVGTLYKSASESYRFIDNGGLPTMEIGAVLAADE